METKNIIVIVLVIAAIGLAYFALATDDGTGLAQDELSKIYQSTAYSSSETFSSTLQDANVVFIIMDLRSSVEPTRTNIMQCGTDFAGSVGIAGKPLEIMAIEGAACTLLNKTASISECVGRITSTANSAAIFIRSHNDTAFYKNNVVVGVSQSYKPKDCGINVKK